MLLLGIIAIVISGCAPAAQHPSATGLDTPVASEESERGAKTTRAGENRHENSQEQLGPRANRSRQQRARSDDPSRIPYMTRTCRVDDEVADVAGGRTPRYADLRRASIDVGGSMVVFRLDVAGDLPATLPEGENLIIGIGLQEGENAPATAVIAQAMARGWKSVLRVGNRQVELSKEFYIDERTLTWRIEWERLSGPRDLEWGASLRWFRFEPGEGPTEGEQAGDRAPEDGPTLCSLEHARKKGGTS